MFPKRYQLGDLLDLHAQARKADGTIAAPDAAPVAAIFAATDPTTAVKSISLPIDDRYSSLQRFHTMDPLDGDYSAGVYHIAYTWLHSTVTNG